MGLGGTATAAAWTDTATAGMEVTAGTFSIQLNSGHGWTTTNEHVLAPAAFFPGAEVFQLVRVQTRPDSTVAGEVRVRAEGISSPPSQNLLAEALRYQAVIAHSDGRSASPSDCTAAAFTPTADYVFGTAGSAIPLSPQSSAITRPLKAEAADEVAYCFRVTLPLGADSAMQGSTASHTWTWEAVSVGEEAP